MNKATQTIAQKRENECLVESCALGLRLTPLRRANWLTVLVPALISAIAGAEILTGASNVYLKYIIGGATLVASLLVVVHKALNCDAYQTEADRVRRGYDALAVKYRMVNELNPPDSETRLIALDESLAALKETGTANIPNSYRTQAEAFLAQRTHATTTA